MAIKATSQMTIVDLSDGKSLSVYITSNHPKTQGFDPNASAYTPSWAGTALSLTPVVFVNQTAQALTAPELAITWKRKEGSTAETAITTGESASAGVLTVNQNKLSSVASGLLSYLCYVAYNDPDTGLVINAVADITFALVKSALNTPRGSSRTLCSTRFVTISSASRMTWPLCGIHRFGRSSKRRTPGF